jgi:hypothetical protein
VLSNFKPKKANYHGYFVTLRITKSQLLATLASRRISYGK